MKKFCAFTAFEMIKDLAKRKDMKLWTADCSMCKYPLGYMWINDQLHYDSGCDCLRQQIVEPRKEIELLNFIRDNPARVERILPLLQSISH